MFKLAFLEGFELLVEKWFGELTEISSAYIEKSKIPNPADVTLYLSVNKQDPPNQKDSTNLMLWPIPELLSSISSVMTIEPGDIILTGTPKGVGKVEPGDHIDAGIEINGKEIPESKISVDVSEKGGIYNFTPS